MTEPVRITCAHQAPNAATFCTSGSPPCIRWLVHTGEFDEHDWPGWREWPAAFLLWYLSGALLVQHTRFGKIRNCSRNLQSPLWQLAHWPPAAVG